MDVEKLVTLGRVERTMAIPDVGDIVLATPPTSHLQSEDPFTNIAQFVIKIGDQDFSAPEKKTDLIEILKRLQIAVFAKIVSICGEMSNEQTKFVEGLFTKK